MQILAVLLVVIFLKQTTAVSLPKYIKLCRGSDPDFDKCGLESGKEAIKHLVRGEKSLRLLPLSPLKLPLVQLENRVDFQLNISDAEVLGLDRAELVEFHGDLEKRYVRVVIYLPEILVNGQFHVDGRVLILPIKGNGPGTVKAYGGNYTYAFHYDLIKKSDVTYSKITKHDLSFTLEKAEFDLEKVFGSDSVLGKETTKFLNENWADIKKDFDEVIGRTIGSICKNIVSNVFERVPYNELILP